MKRGFYWIQFSSGEWSVAYHEPAIKRWTEYQRVDVRPGTFKVGPYLGDKQTGPGTDDVELVEPSE